MWTSDRDETLSTERMLQEYPHLQAQIAAGLTTLDSGDGRVWARHMRRCPFCQRESPPGYITCGKSECQESVYYAGQRRNRKGGKRG